MRVYVGQTRSRKLITELITLGFGECCQPREFPPRRTPWFLDNAAFSAWRAGKEFEDERFIVAMERASDSEVLPDFVVCPDRVAHPESLAFSRSWLDICKGTVTSPVFLAVQDGMEITPETVSGFDGIFVGGTLEWKVATGLEWRRLAHSLSMICHVGRVGTAKRVRWALRIGADSIDSCLPLWSQGNLRTFVNALDPVQQSLFVTYRG